MKKYLSLLTLLALLLVQFHGIDHLELDNNDNEHHCAICEIVSHQPVITPSTIDIVLSPASDLVNLFQSAKISFSLETLLSKSIAPRAPPIA